MENKEKTIRSRGTDGAKVIQIIVTETTVGQGTPDDPCRRVEQYWFLDGTPLARIDPIAETSVQEA